MTLSLFKKSAFYFYLKTGASFFTQKMEPPFIEKRWCHMITENFSYLFLSISYGVLLSLDTHHLVYSLVFSNLRGLKVTRLQSSEVRDEFGLRFARTYYNSARWSWMTTSNNLSSLTWHHLFLRTGAFSFYSKSGPTIFWKKVLYNTGISWYLYLPRSCGVIPFLDLHRSVYPLVFSKWPGLWSRQLQGSEGWIIARCLLSLDCL